MHDECYRRIRWKVRQSWMFREGMSGERPRRGRAKVGRLGRCHLRVSNNGGGICSSMMCAFNLGSFFLDNIGSVVDAEGRA